MNSRAVPLFTITVRDESDRRIVTLGGEFDTAQVERFEDDLADGSDVPVLVIDLGSVTLIDSAALGAMLRLRQHRAERGWTTQIHAPENHQQRVFEVTGLAHLLSADGAGSNPAGAADGV